MKGQGADLPGRDTSLDISQKKKRSGASRATTKAQLGLGQVHGRGGETTLGHEGSTKLDHRLKSLSQALSKWKMDGKPGPNLFRGHLNDEKEVKKIPGHLSEALHLQMLQVHSREAAQDAIGAALFMEEGEQGQHLQRSIRHLKAPHEKGFQRLACSTDCKVRLACATASD